MSSEFSRSRHHLQNFLRRENLSMHSFGVEHEQLHIASFESAIDLYFMYIDSSLSTALMQNMLGLVRLFGLSRNLVIFQACCNSIMMWSLAFKRNLSQRLSSPLCPVFHLKMFRLVIDDPRNVRDLKTGKVLS